MFIWFLDEKRLWHSHQRLRWGRRARGRVGGGGGGRQQIFINVDAEKPHSAAIICNYIMKLHDAHLLAKLK